MGDATTIKGVNPWKACKYSQLLYAGFKWVLCVPFLSLCFARIKETIHHFSGIYNLTSKETEVLLITIPFWRIAGETLNRQLTYPKQSVQFSGPFLQILIEMLLLQAGGLAIYSRTHMDQVDLGSKTDPTFCYL